MASVELSTWERRPPSGDNALAFTLLGALFLWLLLPFAVYFQRKARREAAESDGAYVWPRRLWNRPILLWLVVLATQIALVLAMVSAGLYGD